MKLDFKKAYDLVRWSFVDHVLQNMGFSEIWRGWIQGCLTSAAMPVLVNGFRTKFFNMHKGLHQGDPLSVFLFVLVAEVLNRMIVKAKEARLIDGLLVGKNKVELTHLYFANDTILFCPAKKKTFKN